MLTALELTCNNQKHTIQYNEASDLKTLKYSHWHEGKYESYKQQRWNYSYNLLFHRKNAAIFKELDMNPV